jgi:hypothetical protein
MAATASGGSSCGMPNRVRMTLAVAVPDGKRSFSLQHRHIRYVGSLIDCQLIVTLTVTSFNTNERALHLMSTRPSLSDTNPNQQQAGALEASHEDGLRSQRHGDEDAKERERD